MSLIKAFEAVEPIYILPKDDVATEVIIPGLSASAHADVMIGFFSSQSLAEIAPGLASYLRASSAPLRLVISPYLSATDQDALRRGLSPETLVGIKFDDQLPNADALARHALTCLAWLIAQARLEMKVALMRDALFHPKVWLFHDEDNIAALHGSANMTGAGLGRNREQLSIARGWTGDDASRTCARLAAEFELLWSGGDNDCIVIDLPTAIEERLLRDYKSERPPDEDDYRLLWRQAHGLPELVPESASRPAGEIVFAIPEWLDYRSGDYAHQGVAVDSWRDSGWRGILEMCTGSGKTLTAMVGAHTLHAKVGPLLIIVAAPYNVLVQQWCNEIELFGLHPVNLTAEPGPKGRDRVIADARRRLRLGLSPAEVLVTSNDTLCTAEFIEAISRHAGPKLLIADECHNLGAAGFMTAPPTCFDHRLGLSATPVRQYDQDGTAALFEYFGPTCFSFTLEEAIGRCLTPYDYHAHFVSLDDTEMVEWRDLTEKIVRLAWKLDAGIKDEWLESLLLQRRRVLETASAKMTCLAELLDDEPIENLRYTLIYATDKDPTQLELVNALLAGRDISFHQLTATETADPKMSARILARFQSGALRVLTAKRVLDEGVNVPQIEKAYILASTTVRRQWVQRRGRLLRMCKEIGKTHAVIHDLVTLPPGAMEGERMDEESKKVIRSELDRVWEFARLSRNGARTGGPFEQVEQLRSMLLGGGRDGV
ncbi:Superfamily II DNA or RNA helicase [Mesorhizobium sp. NFR06]|uniref:DEAD/DEAH box helicase family protein n=1 Tax=Mesorhizobium sp. NFR06 TaxID=1566290 RepID=UPI0008E9EA70|nr:DEAD/DEAH box helicase family protein [Mesorhizobium sp. NFR06]SFO57901.1 Superfamily II DNA or RNA helicase [Mesorhizobium sp. NFR06]